MKRKVFTLAELIIVVIVLGILISFGIPTYQKTVREAQDQEAKTTLRLIAAAEKTKMNEIGAYLRCGAGDECNTEYCNRVLGLDISSKTWEYSLPWLGEVDIQGYGLTFCAEAKPKDPGKGAGTGDWHIHEYNLEPIISNCRDHNCTR